MKQRYEYDVKFFVYSKELNSFYADAWELHTHEHQRAFPNDKQQFYITNPKTGGYRRFTFKKEVDTHYLFESKDGIRCVICIQPGYYEQETELPIYPPFC